jgi:hypothetical protein
VTIGAAESECDPARKCDLVEEVVECRIGDRA